MRAFKSREQSINPSTAAKALPILFLAEALTPNSLLQQRSRFNETAGPAGLRWQEAWQIVWHGTQHPCQEHEGSHLLTGCWSPAPQRVPVLQQPYMQHSYPLLLSLYPFSSEASPGKAAWGSRASLCWKRCSGLKQKRNEDALGLTQWSWEVPHSCLKKTSWKPPQMLIVLPKQVVDHQKDPFLKGLLGRSQSKKVKSREPRANHWEVSIPLFWPKMCPPKC